MSALPISSLLPALVTKPILLMKVDFELACQPVCLLSKCSKVDTNQEKLYKNRMTNFFGTNGCLMYVFSWGAGIPVVPGRTIERSENPGEVKCLPQPPPPPLQQPWPYTTLTLVLLL